MSESWSRSLMDPDTLGFGVPELVPARMEAGRQTFSGIRLNLIIPVVKKEWAFGGVATALRFFESLAGQFEYTRIILLNQPESQFAFADWSGWVADWGTPHARSVAFVADQRNPLAVFENDLFIATFWSTALYARGLISQQQRLFGEIRRRFVYLIQDYEPAFYPGSVRQVHAQSTYGDRDHTIAVFNSQHLCNYFADIGLRFPEQYVFEPKLNSKLRQKKVALGNVNRQRLILVYGRPSVPRNDFDLVVDSLRSWARSFPSACEWKVVSAGEDHPDIPLGRDVVLESLGKLSLEEYARQLSQCWIGLSFIFTPATSYTQLEMAEFGAWTITNSYANRDLSHLASNIISLNEPLPETVAEKLAWCCSQYRPGAAVAAADSPSVFKGDENEFPFAGALVRSWRQQ